MKLSAKTLYCFCMIFLPFPGHSEESVLERSMELLEHHTCIKFIEIEQPYEAYSHYVHFISTANKR